jgi:integrase
VGRKDAEKELLRVHRQLTRYGEHGKLKTDAGRREVIPAPAVVSLLRERRRASASDGPEDFVFTNTLGRYLNYRHVGDAFRAAVRKADLGRADRISLHSLRHGYASTLIASGLNVVFVSRQLGHANSNVTLSTYAHEFARHEHGEAAREALEASYEAMASQGP